MKKWRVRVKLILCWDRLNTLEHDINEFLDARSDIVVNDIRLHSSMQMQKTIAVITYKEPYYDVEDEDDEA